jgi:hypothetical protein
VLHESVSHSPVNRGNCLISKVTVELVGSSSAVTAFTSSGTGESEFVVESAGGGWHVILASAAR